MFSQLIHILNIWTILLSTVGIATYSHYCQDELKTVSFFVNTTKPCCKKNKPCCKKTKTKCSSTVLKKTKSCCSDSKKTSPSYISCFNKEQSEKTAFKKKNCCLDKKGYNQADVETTLEPLDFDILFKYHPITPSYNYNFTREYYTFNPQEIKYASLSFFPPPDVPLYILHQSFLC
ncbi:MAG: hypothetical protein JKY03_03445 [Aureispira sp.]|nr:hypothetical protein [Aureispira sp.]